MCVCVCGGGGGGGGENGKVGKRRGGERDGISVWEALVSVISASVCIGFV